MSRAKRVPVRRCVACRRERPQGDLVRFHREAESWRLDTAYLARGRKSDGRGAWVCADNPECWRVKKLRRFFRGQTERLHGELLAHAKGQAQPESAQNGYIQSNQVQDRQVQRSTPSGAPQRGRTTQDGGVDV